MNKFSDFFVSNLIIVVFVLVSVLLGNYYLLANFKISHEIYFVVFLVLILIGILFYYFLSKSIFEDMKKSNNGIDFLIRQTLHELNTPVASIKANLSLLKKNENDPKRLERLGRIEFASDKLFELYEAMEYEIKSKIGKTSKEKFGIDEAVQKSFAKHKDLDKTIKLNSQNCNREIFCDRLGFQKVIDNLVSNAIKYNKQNGFVEIFLEADTLKIKDSGIGIEAKNLFAVFEAYFQEDANKKGFGIGLAIVKDFCDTNKIKIEIDSNDNGTTFELNLRNVMV